MCLKLWAEMYVPTHFHLNVFFKPEDDGASQDVIILHASESLQQHYSEGTLCPT